MSITFPVLPARPASPTHTYTVNHSGGITVTLGIGSTIYVTNIDDSSQLPGPFFVPPWGSPAVTLEFGNTPPYDASTLTNGGIIWNYSTIYGAVAVRAGFITNTGWIIAESILPSTPNPSGYDYGSATALQSVSSLNNSGTVYAYATGFANAVSAGGQAIITNSGTIAAHSVVAPNANVGGANGYAVGFRTSQPLVEFTNTATGQVLAQGPEAVGLQFHAGMVLPDAVSVTNHGLIEAVSTDAGFPSVGIFAAQLQAFEHITIVNDGTIRADVAIYAANDPGFDIPGGGLPVLTTQIVRNLAGGLIDGDIVLKLGDDAVYNAGTIIGRVDLGDGWDLFDGTGGTVNGLVDLGIGYDLFIGGAGGDVARGGFGNDDLTGGAGNDLLLGDGNADILEGQGGSDGLYGGTGDDWLITQGGDFADGGRGDDLFSSEDYTFAQIVGGTGADIWELPTGTRALDLTTVLASGRISGIDQLELSTGKTLTISEADVIGLSDDAFLALTGGAGSTIYLPESWSASAPVTIAGHKYIFYTRGSTTLVVDIDATVTLGSPPAPGGGLDAVAAGAAAPLPGIIPGTEISNLFDSSGGLQFLEDQVIDIGQIIESTSGNFAVGTFTRFTAIQFDNYGIIRSLGDDQAGGFYEAFVAVLSNYGAILAYTTGAGPAIAVQGNTALDVYNSGVIDAAAGSGQAIAISIRAANSLVNPAVNNDGEIYSTSETGRATGIHFVYGSNANVLNNGDIIAQGGDGAVGIDYEPGYSGSSTVTNSGYIAANAPNSASGPRIGIRMHDGSVINSGTIQAGVAVQFDNAYSAATLNNSFMIFGDIVAGPSSFGLNLTNSAGATILGAITINSTYNEYAPASPSFASQITNRGTITGDVRFGAGYDVFDTLGGTFNGSVYGGLGNDTFKVDSQATLLFEYADQGTDTVETAAGYSLGANFENLVLTGNGNVNGLGNTLDNTLAGNSGANLLTGGLGNDSLDGGSNVDTAVVSGNRSAYTVTQTSTGVFSVVGPDGTDTLTGVEFLQFADQLLRLLPGTGTGVDFNSDPDTYMAAIRDFDGNNLGAGDGWLHIGAADIDGDGDTDQILVNRTIGRFAEVAAAPDGLVYFADHGWAGETRVVGIYIDPLVASGQVVAGGPFDSQTRFQNDLFIENINGVLGGADYDHDGLQEVYFKLTDGTAYLHAYMHADGNIRYANYQSQQQVIDFLTSEGWAPSTWASWFPSNAAAPPKPDPAMDAAGFDFGQVESLAGYAGRFDGWQAELQAGPVYG